MDQPQVRCNFQTSRKNFHLPKRPWSWVPLDQSCRMRTAWMSYIPGGMQLVNYVGIRAFRQLPHNQVRIWRKKKKQVPSSKNCGSGLYMGHISTQKDESILPIHSCLDWEKIRRQNRYFHLFVSFFSQTSVTSLFCWKSTNQLISLWYFRLEIWMMPISKIEQVIQCYPNSGRTFHLLPRYKIAQICTKSPTYQLFDLIFLVLRWFSPSFPTCWARGPVGQVAV